MSSSPLRFLSKMLVPEQADSRSHPDATGDVWEISVWDPTSLGLRLFCLFSPGHVVLYCLFLPTAMMNTRPSITIVTTIVLASLLSTQLMILQSSFTQQSKDTSVIHKEVLNEYDTKFVHPRTRPTMRDVGTQCSKHGAAVRGETDSVDIYKPAVIINRRFDIRPNPNYVKHLAPHGTTLQDTPSRNYGMSRGLSLQNPTAICNPSSPSRSVPAIQQPHLRPSFGVKNSNGGNLGVYSHANSPLRKARSTNFADTHHQDRSSSPAKREGSPLKRLSLAPAGQHGQQAGHSYNSAARRESGRF